MSRLRSFATAGPFVPGPIAAMSVGQPPASTIAEYRSDAFAVAKKVSGRSVGSGSSLRAVSRGGAGGATFFGFGGAAASTGAGEAAGGAAAGAASAPVAGGAAPVTDGAATFGAGMNGLTRASGAECAGAGLAGAAEGEGEAAGADGVCASAPDTRRGSPTSAPAIKTRSIIIKIRPRPKHA